MIEVLRTPELVKWLRKVRDRRAATAIATRIDRLAEGNFGDARAVGEGISELRIDVGAGYRVYYTRVGTLVILLLLGGDKSTQIKDISKAQRLAREWREV